MRLNLLLFLLICLFAYACSDRGEEARVTDQSDLQPTGPAAVEARTVVKGEPMFVEQFVYEPDSLVAARSREIGPAPEKVRTRINNYSFVSSRKIQDTKSLVTLTPGRDSVPAPEPVPARPKRVPIIQTEPVEALPPRMKDIAIYDIQYLDVDQGLVSSYIRSMMEDSLGNLWFGSSYGVSRYDGNTFLHFTTESGLTHNSVSCMHQDKNGDIWFGTGKGVTQYDGQQFFHYTKTEGFANCSVQDIYESSNGDLWFGTNQGLILLKRDAAGDQFIQYTKEHGLVSDYVLSIASDDRGYLWFGTGEGVSRYDGTGFTNYTSQSGLISNFIYSIFKDNHGDLWFGTDRGVSRYDGEVFVNYLNQEDDVLQGGVLAIMEDKRGDIWLGTNQGILRYESKLGKEKLTQYTTEDGLSSLRVRSIIEDSDGILWFGTGGGGVNRFKNTGFTHYTSTEGLTDNGIVFVEEDLEGNLWFGTDKGLNRYQGNSFTHFTTREGLLDNDIRCGILDDRGKMWFGTAKGLSRFDGDVFTNYTEVQGLPDDEVVSLLEDRNGWFWMGTRAGICHFNPQDLRDKKLWFLREDSLINNAIHTLLEDAEGNIWMASEKGLWRYTPQSGGGMLTHFTTENGLLNDYVTTLYEDSKGNIWLGTMSGLNLYDADAEGDQFIDYTVKDGLGNNVIWSIKEDRKNNLWLSTEKGITMLRPVASEKETAKPDFNFYTFDKGDGLKRLDFHANSVCLDRQNRMWWGSEGATMLDLSLFQLATEPPKFLHLTNIDVNQEFVDYRRLPDGLDNAAFQRRNALGNSFDSVSAFYNYPLNLDLPYHLDHLTFHFSANAWDRPHRVEYQYYMKGLENDWGQIRNEPTVDYRNLSYGHYSFMVRARVDEGVWSEPVTYKFHIRPAPWWSWWSWTLYLLTFFGISVGLTYLMKKRWLLKTQLKEVQEKSDKFKRRENFRSKVYTNLTHEFRTPLSVILGMAEQIETDPGRYLKQGVDLIQKNGNKLLRLINQLLDLAKLEDNSLKLDLKRGDIISYLDYCAKSFKNFARKEGVTLNFESNVRRVVMDYDPEQVDHIMTNLISNAIKFTPSGGFVTVSADRRDNDLMIEVEDTGMGIASENLDQVFNRFYQVDASITRENEGTGIGLAHTYELVKLMEGDIEVMSTKGQGTTFVVRLPIRLSTDNDITPYEPLPIPEPEDIGIVAETLQEEISPVDDNDETSEQPRVLIVEDDHSTMVHLVSCLARKYKIDLANNGRMGIEKALKNIPDLIISDVMMPEVSGFDLCHTLKNDERTSHIPIILLTAKADIDSKIKGLATGADAYLYKPFRRQELLVRLGAMVDKQQKLQAHFARKFEHGLVVPQPVEGEPAEIPETEDKFMDGIREIVANNYHLEGFTMMDICDEIGMSRSQLYRKMKALTGTSPSEFIRKYRLEKAKILLETTDMIPSQVAYATGYKDHAHFTKSFSEEYQILPSNVAKKP